MYRFQKLGVWVLPFTLLLLISCSRTRHSTTSSGVKENVLKEKYAVALGVSESEIRNLTLYRFVEEWTGVKYKYAGKDKNGIDCSGFTSRLQKDVFKKEVSGPSWSIAQNCESVKRSEVKEGDLVFFKIDSPRISHVGVYLQNGHFVHASTSKGVIISSLDEKYYTKYLDSFGRPR